MPTRADVLEDPEPWMRSTDVPRNSIVGDAGTVQGIAPPIATKGLRAVSSASARAHGPP